MRVCGWVRGALMSTVVEDALIHLPRRLNYPVAALVKKRATHTIAIYLLLRFGIYVIYLI